MNDREWLLEGLWQRLARHARAPASARTFIVEALTHLLSTGLVFTVIGSEIVRVHWWIAGQVITVWTAIV